jgi:hypothetical protein
MVRPGFVALTAVAVLLASGDVFAQRARRFHPETAYARLGLEVAWSGQIQMDSARTRTGGIHLQVVGLDSFEALQQTMQQVFEVEYNGQVRRYRENDLDAAGRRLGREEAQRLAEKFIIQLQARGIAANLVPRQVPLTILYVQSAQGTLQAMDAETGETLWAVTVGLPNHPALSPSANDRYVGTVSGSRLYLLHRETGQPVWDRDLQQNPAMGPTLSNEFAFVPAINGQVEGYRLPEQLEDRLEDHHGTPPWIYRSGGRITAAPSVTRQTVSWATTLGQMFVADLDGPQMLYRRQTGGPIFGHAAFLPPDQLVVGSTDGYITAMHELDGTMKWSFSLGDDLYQTPLAHVDQVYGVTRHHELFCIGAEQGEERWIATGIEHVLACGKDRVYGLDPFGQLVAIDKKSGARLGQLPIRPHRMALSNGLTDRIYLATDDGGLLCLREMGSSFPVVARPLPEPAESATPRTRAARPPADAAAPAQPPTQPPAAEEEDVFGDETTDEPAGDAGPAVEPAAADAEADTPAPAADEATEDDPFGFE